MSLTSHLKDSQSPIRQFLYEHFPNTRPIVTEARTKLSDVSTIRPESRLPYGTIGTAIDYRLRYYFGVTKPMELVAGHGARILAGSPVKAADGTVRGLGKPIMPKDLIVSFFASLDLVLDQAQPIGKKLDRAHEELLARYCVVLALFEEVFRAGPSPRSPLLSRPHNDLNSFLEISEPHWVDDLCNMSWLFHDKLKRRLSEPAVLNPTFDGSQHVGGADADLILNNILLDIKATINPRVEPSWLYQLLGYVLLDYSDEYKMKGIGLYLARQGVLFEWDITDLLDAVTEGTAPPLKELRSEFQEVATALV